MHKATTASNHNDKAQNVSLQQGNSHTKHTRDHTSPHNRHARVHRNKHDTHNNNAQTVSIQQDSSHNKHTRVHRNKRDTRTKRRRRHHANTCTTTTNTTTPSTRNIDTIHAIQQPHNRKTLRSFLSAVNAYKKFIPDYARLQTPLVNLLKRDVMWVWDDKCQKAFTSLKESLTTHPILHLYKEGLPWQVYCNASTLGIAGVLKQVHPDGKTYTVQNFSRSLRSISELECLAIVESVDKFRVCLMDRKFNIFSDHPALQWLKKIKNPSGRLFRWRLRLSRYEYEIRYINGVQQYETDLIARNPFCGFLDTSLIKSHQPSPSGNSSLTIDHNGLHTVSQKGVTKIIIPTTLTNKLLKSVHTQYNHPNISKMTRLISAQYYWQNMTQDIALQQALRFKPFSSPSQELGTIATSPELATIFLSTQISPLFNILDRDKEIKDLINALSKRLDSWGERLEFRISAIDNRVENINQRLQQLEESSAVTKSRERNLIFYGIEQDHNEDCRERIRKVIEENMQTTEKINITRCHRLSRKPGAPILIEVPEQNDRSTLFKAAFNLRGTKISLSKDYSVKMREQRCVLNVKRRELAEKDRLANGYEIVLAGDINIRTGTYGYLHNPLERPLLLSPERKSRDPVISKHWEQLINFLDNNLLTIINGRTISDKTGNCTFISSRGSSVVDYFIISYSLLEHVVDLKVDNSPYSDHLPLTINMSNVSNLKRTKETVFPCFERYRWAPDNTSLFSQNLDNNQVSTDQNLDSLVNTFSKQIQNAMLAADMRIKVRPGRSKPKPWYNRECYLAKKPAKASLTTFKETNTDVDRNIYVSNRKRYTTLINFNKKKYFPEKREILKNARDSANFWKTIATLKDKRSDLSTLSPIDPELYCEIFITEITREISSLSNEKACGADEIPNEALKTLPFEHLLTLRRKRRKLYAFFVDLKKAFDTVPHSLLWSKLSELGLNFRFVNLIRNYFEQMTTTVRWNGLFTEPIKIRSGVLQGEPLSPYLFILFVTDLINIFNDSTLPGIYLPNFGTVHLLMYADDIILIGEPKINLQIRINMLKKYFETNHLTLNESKSKIIVFRNGGRPAKSDKWFWGDQLLTVTLKYLYLGYPLTTKISFSQVASYFKGKALAATGEVWKIMEKSRLNSFGSSMKLLDSIILSTLLYSAPIWANEKNKILDQIQNNYLRLLLNLPSNTPGYILRMETGRFSLGVTATKLILKFWLRILKMEKSRLPAICLAQLWETSTLTNTFIGFTENLMNILNSTGFMWLKNCSDPNILQKAIPQIIRITIEQSIQTDQSRITNSKLHIHYKYLHKTFAEENYLLNGSHRHTCQVHCFGIEDDTERPSLPIQRHVTGDEYLPKQESHGSGTPISVVALVSTGRMLYFGRRREMLTYFSYLNYPCPSYKNPADYYLDLVTLDTLSAEALLESTQRVEELVATFRQQPCRLSDPGPPAVPLAAVRKAGLLSQVLALWILVLGGTLHHLHGYLPPETTIDLLQARQARFVWGTGRVSCLPRRTLAYPNSEAGVGPLDISGQLRLACLKGSRLHCAVPLAVTLGYFWSQSFF
ncbi:hypothetical protein LAZ67_2005540 [Cordylochernes scorpioides]|uniref:RNA-directed DNA polymerase n=1 Tax=Cordylochernes scorpioides TaxID=51811 RepID=A0ABY6K4H7_9ARAC|nr:hypothetical protein LAZ67_2005540 [Cordylochernes scorpioides]